MVGDLKQFRTAAVQHAADLKRLLTQAKELRDFWDKLNCVASADAVDAPLVKADLDNYATLLGALKDFADNVAVAAADRRGIVERVATNPVSR